MDAQTIYEQVNARYGATARASSNADYGKTVAEAFGYSAEDLASIPQDANLGLSCGNPLALASLKEGEVIVDLGSGAGFDVFLAARKVGEKGRAIGVDMNEDMLAKARDNAQKSGLANTSFVSSKITSIDLPSSSADVVVSNCVINLVPHEEKPRVFEEMFRLLKPGGRVAVSDILAKKDFTNEMRRDIALYVGCVAGASKKEEYENWLKGAGFVDVLVVDGKADLNVYTRSDGQGDMCYGSAAREEKKQEVTCCGSTDEAESGCRSEKKQHDSVVEGMKANLAEIDLNEWAGSFKIFAVKPSQ